MRTFRAHLRAKLQDEEFKTLYDEERELVRIGSEVAEARAKLGMSQTDLTRRANVTQQQVSKVEHGANCNVLTLLKVCRVLRLNCKLFASG